MGADAADAAAASKAIGTANISRQEKKKAAARPRKQIVPKKPELAIKTNEGITSEQLQHQQRRMRETAEEEEKEEKKEK